MNLKKYTALVASIAGLATLIYVLSLNEHGPEQLPKTYVEFTTMDALGFIELEIRRRAAVPNSVVESAPQKEPKTGERKPRDLLAAIPNPKIFGEIELEHVQTKAEAGDVWSQIRLGLIFQNGAGKIAIDVPEAIKWYSAAAANGSGSGPAMANYNLGDMYFTGKLVPNNLLEAEKYYLIAAKGGVWQAEVNLASLYLNRDIYFPGKHGEAAKLYMSLVENGKFLIIAMNNLGHLYFTGKGVSQDFVKAYMWFELARLHFELARLHKVDVSGAFAKTVSDSIAKNLLIVMFNLTPEEVLEGQRLATDWWEAHKKEK